MKISRIIMLVVATGMLAACKADELPPTEQYATFKGVVLDATSSQPVANATVTVDTVLTTTTATDGSFSFPNVPSGDIDYVVTINGYQAVAEHIHADPLATANVTVKLTPLAATHAPRHRARKTHEQRSRAR